MRGMAVSAVLARAVERVMSERGAPHLRPVRWTVDLFRAAAMAPSDTTTAVVRESRGVCLVDAALLQDGKPVARACALYLREGETPAVSAAADSLVTPPPTTLGFPEDERRLFYSDELGWTDEPRRHLDGTRKALWYRPIPTVDGEEPSPFQFVAGVADVANLVANLGTGGLEFINADITLTMARLPRGGEVGLVSRNRLAGNGTAVGVVTVYDRDGVLGTAMVNSLSNVWGGTTNGTRRR